MNISFKWVYTNLNLRLNLFKQSFFLIPGCNPFICTIFFGLLKFSKKILFKDLIQKII